MIIGSGLLARSFGSYFDSNSDACIYAAGVSNSGCNDVTEFKREWFRLTDALDRYSHFDSFVYFSTCSVYDPLSISSAYVQHKLNMEELVSHHSRYLVVRLPQVAGNTPNPHTLLNYIFSRISRSEKLKVWKNARRNIIDVDDVVCIVRRLVNEDGIRGECINVANFEDISMPRIVDIMANVVGKKAICDFLDYGGGYSIDTTRIQEVVNRCGISFDQDYTERVIRKYYERYVYDARLGASSEKSLPRVT